MDSQKVVGLKLHLNFSNGLPERVHRIADMQLNTVVPGFNPVDIVNLDDLNLSLGANRKPLRSGVGCTRLMWLAIQLASLYELLAPIRDAEPRPFHCLAEPLLVERFQ